MALALLRGGTPVGPQLVVPLYMREADAKSNFAQVIAAGPRRAVMTAPTSCESRS